MLKDRRKAEMNSSGCKTSRILPVKLLQSPTLVASGEWCDGVGAYVGLGLGWICLLRRCAWFSKS